MLAFYLNNKPFLLDESTSIRITWQNPACQFKDFPGDIGRGINIPVNDNNRMLLGNPERFQKYSTTTVREFPNFTARFSGTHLLSGTLIITNAGKSGYKGWLRSETGNLGKIHREKYIYDIDAFNQDIVFTNKANYNPLTDPYGCPSIYNPDFFYDKGRKVNVDIQVPNPDYYEGSGRPAFIPDKEETEALSEAFRKTGLWFVNYLNPDNTVKIATDSCSIRKYETDLDVTVVSPMLFLNFIIEQLLKDAGLYIENNALTNHAELQKLIVYNNFDITNMTFERTDPWVIQNWYDGITTQYKLNIGANVTRDYTGTFKYKHLLPKVSLKDFILGIQNELNMIFHFRGNGKLDIIDRNEIIDGDVIDISQYLTGDWEKDEQKDVTLKFLFKHDKNDNMFQERWEDIDDCRENEGEPVDAWDDLEAIETPEIGEIRYLKSVNIYVEYALIETTTPDPAGGKELLGDAVGWQHVALGFQNGFYNRGKADEEEIKTCFSSLVGDQTTMAAQPGNLNGMRFAYQNFTPRLLFYLGNNVAKMETDNLALDWEKTGKNLLDNRWAKWNRFWCQRLPVKRTAELPLNVLNYSVRNITKKHRGYEGEFIHDSIETSFGLHRIGESKLNAFKA